LRVEVFCEITFVIVCNGIFVIDGLGWVGLGYENLTHGHVCVTVHRMITISFALFCAIYCYPTVTF